MQDWTVVHKRYFLVACALPAIYALIWWAGGFAALPWDAIWYRSIVVDGYRFSGNVLEYNNVAFLPGYPLLVSLVYSLIGLDAVWSQFAASTICYLGGCYFFAKVFLQAFGRSRTLIILTAISVNPFAFYFVNGYSEPLLFLVCGIFFFGLSTQRFFVSASILSYGLIARPHAVALYPVLLYAVAQRHQIVGRGVVRNMAAYIGFFRASVDLVSVSLICPILLTVFWYFKFGDSLLYVNALTGWSNSNSQSIYRQLGLLIGSLIQLQTIDIDLAGRSFKIIAPHQFAAWLVILNAVAVIALVRLKQIEFALFNAGLIAFWLLTSVSMDSGRHALLQFALPILISFVLLPSAAKTNGLPIVDWKSHAARILTIAGGAGFLLLEAFHWIAYAWIQLNGGWVS